MIKICSAIIALLVLIALAGPVAYAETIIFTEQSSSNLEVTLGGSDFGTVTLYPSPPFPPQLWNWDFPVIIGGKTTSFGSIAPALWWLEPGGDPAAGGPWNNLTNNGNTGLSYFIASEDLIVPPPGSSQFLLDSTTVPGYFTVHFTDGSSADYGVQFIDLANDATPVPEPSTMLLLGSGFIGLAGFARKKSKK